MIQGVNNLNAIRNVNNVDPFSEFSVEFGSALNGPQGLGDQSVAGPSFGQSERMTVSPGREEEGLFNMPGGQSGHPLSPHFLGGHEEWVKGRPLPLLPGAARHVLEFVPSR